ncbi:protein of unknown function [Agrobacterium pusense]|uniref:Uncharacterized protein n=1 Tax=Agrobacterium pusense TaxID=648995 RepID=U4PTQ7_9HYPH|nr:protein of unknown function [Agrobacterium pusense]
MPGEMGCTPTSSLRLMNNYGRLSHDGFAPTGDIRSEHVSSGPDCEADIGLNCRGGTFGPLPPFKPSVQLLVAASLDQAFCHYEYCMLPFKDHVLVASALN